MSRLLILGAGIAGHTAAMHARHRLPTEHEVVVVSPNSHWNWIPSNIWVATGYMRPDQVTFRLDEVYKKLAIPFHQARAVSIHPDGGADRGPFVTIEYTSPEKRGQTAELDYDYLINATGPRLNFGATPGLGPEANSWSVCTSAHASQTATALNEVIARMERGETQTLLIGTGHGTCTCQGAAFEYLFNVEHELRRRGVRDKARLVWISNEAELGDFGMGGMFLRRGGYVTHSRVFAESLYTERGVEWITGAHVREVGAGETSYETLSGENGSIRHDFAMLLPPFTGVPLRGVSRDGTDITGDLFAPNQFMLVDADYTKKPYDAWSPSDWPDTYQSPRYPNLFAVGIAFAPPHPISKPMTSVNGTSIFPTPPRTGMPSGIMARQVALNISDMMVGRATAPTRKASMAHMGAACIASAGAGLIGGSAVSMTVFPIVPDFRTYPDTGRDLHYTSGEIGLAGHWLKHALHYAFMYKAQAKPLWIAVPE